MIFFSKLIRRIFGLLGIHIERSVSRDQVLALVSSLRALTTQVPLIRVGAENDGGYLIPDDLVGIDYVFSPGVGKKSWFELDLVERGLSAFLCDYSVSEPPIRHPRFQFLRKYLGVTNDDQHLTLTTWVEDSIGSVSNDLILQMDIEGSEYQVLLSTPIETLCRFRIIVVEFHFLEFVGSRLSYNLISSTFLHLMGEFSIVHVHPNNCCSPVAVSGVTIHPVIEVTFLRKDRIRTATANSQSKHPLDSDCVPSAPSIDLAKEWYWR